MRRERPTPPPEQILEETMLLKSQIGAIYNDSRNKPFPLNEVQVISRAIMRVAEMRARKRIERLREKHGVIGWLCGTHSNQLRQTIEIQLKRMYLPEELSRIVICCASGAYDDDASGECDEQVFNQLWALIPRLHINLLHLDFD